MSSNTQCMGIVWANACARAILRIGNKVAAMNRHGAPCQPFAVQKLDYGIETRHGFPTHIRNPDHIAHAGGALMLRHRCKQALHYGCGQLLERGTRPIGQRWRAKLIESSASNNVKPTKESQRRAAHLLSHVGPATQDNQSGIENDTPPTKAPSQKMALRTVPCAAPCVAASCRKKSQTVQDDPRQP